MMCGRLSQCQQRGRLPPFSLHSHPPPHLRLVRGVCWFSSTEGLCHGSARRSLVRETVLDRRVWCYRSGRRFARSFSIVRSACILSTCVCCEYISPVSLLQRSACVDAYLRYMPHVKTDPRRNILRFIQLVEGILDSRNGRS